MTEITMLPKLGIKFKIDPLNKFEKISKDHILGLLGVLPMWAITALHTTSAMDTMHDQYQFGSHLTHGGEILEDGSYEYPEDPILYPIALMKGSKETIYFYQYSLIGVVDNEDNSIQAMSRFD